MYKYKFECRTTYKESNNIHFVVTGTEEDRKSCVKVHNALLASQWITITGVSISEEG